MRLSALALLTAVLLATTNVLAEKRYTPTTITDCNNGKCQLTAYAGTVYDIGNDGLWHTIGELINVTYNEGYITITKQHNTTNDTIILKLGGIINGEYREAPELGGNKKTPFSRGIADAKFNISIDSIPPQILNKLDAIVLTVNNTNTTTEDSLTITNGDTTISLHDYILQGGAVSHYNHTYTLTELNKTTGNINIDPTITQNITNTSWNYYYMYGSIYQGTTDRVGCMDPCASYPMSVGLYFPNITLTGTATINSAQLQIYWNSKSGGGAGTTKIYGDANDSLGPPTTGAAHTARARTSNYANVSSGTAQWYNQTVTSVVAEIIARPGWSSGNPIGLFIQNHSTTTALNYDMWRDAEYGGYTPLLYINYTEAAGSDPCAYGTGDYNIDIGACSPITTSITNITGNIYCSNGTVAIINAILQYKGQLQHNSTCYLQINGGAGGQLKRIP